MDVYDPTTVFSSIDHGGRYAYGNQPTIGLWNMARLAEALLPLIDDDQERAVELATESLDRYERLYDEAWLAGMRAKLGLVDDDDGGGRALANDWLELLQSNQVDFTTAFRRLADAADGSPESPVGVTSLFEEPIGGWLDRWTSRIRADAQATMRIVNPVYVPRNHLVEESLDAATGGDLAPFQRLLEVVTDPFDEQAGRERFVAPAPDGFTAGFQTFCGT
jgi:uncharacterized protein YdiU (UPF0061 family)